MNGKVFLVGAGPGDIGLITVKGLELLRSAEVVVHDALIDPRILKECRNAEMIDAGKRGGNHTMTQSETNSKLVELAKEGKIVVRLKGGDPFMFGRGAEEAAELRKAGIDVQVVPGVSSSIAVPELAGIPLTHRDNASMVTIVTGHERADRESDRTDWKKMASLGGTIVILMGIGNSDSISKELMNGGLPGGTPAAVITMGSTDEQRTEVTTLSSLHSVIISKGIEAPGIIVIGDVVRQRDVLGDMF
ncbi:MAG: uroporphyrinogen-III C-methyltransferase [Methanomassiliicoccaceae archaeon]|jgi:uroporphyrin-III C-methyltransferase|nr:uroporphyrinogen-III C-methyltransferase [Methanomassiliicoccaceae archaeon]